MLTTSTRVSLVAVSSANYWRPVLPAVAASSPFASVSRPSPITALEPPPATTSHSLVAIAFQLLFTTTSLPSLDIASKLPMTILFQSRPTVASESVLTSRLHPSHRAQSSNCHRVIRVRAPVSRRVPACCWFLVINDSSSAEAPTGKSSLFPASKEQSAPASLQPRARVSSCYHL